MATEGSGETARIAEIRAELEMFIARWRAKKATAHFAAEYVGGWNEAIDRMTAEVEALITESSSPSADE